MTITPYVSLSLLIAGALLMVSGATRNLAEETPPIVPIDSPSREDSEAMPPAKPAVSQIQRIPAAQGAPVFRVKCGTTTVGSDPDWLVDQKFQEGATYGAIGGNVCKRDDEIPFNSETPELYRHERFNMSGYVFAVANGIYTIRLHMTESFESNFRAGLRVFDISVGQQVALPAFDVFAEGGGFGRVVVMEVRGVRVDNGRLDIGFTPKPGSPAICGIEVFQAPADTAFAVQKLTTPVPTPVWGLPKLGIKTEKLLFVGNSFFIFWAIPETLASMVNSGQQAVQLETRRCTLGGRRLAFLWESDPGKTALKAVEQGGNDHVVMLVAVEKDVPWARGLEILDRGMALVRKHGARPVLHWADIAQNWTPKDVEQHKAELLDLARKHQGVLLPVRIAWDQGERERPDLNWKNPDGAHPSLHQAYLTVCLHYILWTGRSPKGHPHPYVIDRGLRIEDEPAAYLQDLAERIMKAEGFAF